MDRWYSDNKVLRFADVETPEHIAFIQGYTRIIAEHYARLYPKSRMTMAKIEKITKAAAFHDIGKLAVLNWILLNDGRLSEGEIEMLKEHTTKGCEIVHLMGQTEDEEYNRICHNIVLYHHEKYDGTGYPYGLKKDKIPIEAQMVALADMYDVLIHGKGERQRFTKEEAYCLLLQGEFGELSPRLKECLTNAKEELEAFVVEKQ